MSLRDRKLAIAAAGGLAAALLLGACGDADDGATVREEGPGASLSGSASASASGSGPGSGSASGSASTAAGECELVGNSDAEPTGEVTLDLTEFSIAAEPGEIEAGTINFVAENGGEEIHEVVIIRYDGDPADLPVDDQGGADESQLPRGAVIGEIEGFAAGATCSGAFDLGAGDYVLLCNIIEEESGTIEPHYGMGMYTTFAVT